MPLWLCRSVGRRPEHQRDGEDQEDSAGDEEGRPEAQGRGEQAPAHGPEGEANGGGGGGDAESLALASGRGRGFYGEVSHGYGAAYEEAREKAQGPERGNGLGKGLRERGEAGESQRDDHDAAGAEAGGEAPAYQGAERGNEGSGADEPTRLARPPIGPPRPR